MANRRTSADKPSTEPSDIARSIELTNLRRERDNLRELFDGEPVDELVMLRAEVSALKQAAARAGLTSRPRNMSEGVREEIERVGYSVDPSSGVQLTSDDLPDAGR